MIAPATLHPSAHFDSEVAVREIVVRELALGSGARRQDERRLGVANDGLLDHQVHAVDQRRHDYDVRRLVQHENLLLEERCRVSGAPPSR